MHELTTQEIPIGSVSNLPISLTVIEIGEGHPTLSILCGLHGDEPLGLLACQQFLLRLSKPPGPSGAVRVVAVSNPLAQSQKARVSSADFLDLNRLGAGDETGSLTERQAAAIFNVVKGSAFVVDLHEFRMRTPLMALYLSSEREELNEIMLRGINSFGPRLIWVMDPAHRLDVVYSQSLVGALIRKGVPSIAIEGTAGGGFREVVSISDGLWRIASFMGIVRGEVGSIVPPIAIRREVFTADTAGVWQPSASLMHETSSLDLVGTLTSINLQENYQIRPPKKGVLIQILDYGLVHTGISLFAVGYIDKDLSDAVNRFEPSQSIESGNRFCGNEFLKS